MSADKYHKRPEWSYSSLKHILDSGIDYAVACRKGIVPSPSSKFIDLGQLVHQMVLGGDETFVLSPFDSFRTKEAQQWRDNQIANDKIIITGELQESAEQVVANIKNHPHSKKYLFGKGVKHEQEMFAKTSDGVDLRGKADAIKIVDKDALIITDLKTTAQFDKFVKSAYWSHYDLQAAVYTLISASYLKVHPSLINYYFCVAETVAPYRVQYVHAGMEFVEAGERKLRICIDEVLKFGDREPNFLLEEIKELGDWSL